MNQFDSKQNPSGNVNDQADGRENAGYIFLTGATGLVGQFLIKDLLLQNQNLALLVRPNKKQTAHQRIESIIQRWETELGHHLPRPVVFEGDLKNEQLSVSNEDHHWIKQNCDRIIHNAAVLTFNGLDRNHEPWITNLTGTKHVLKFCSNCNIEELHYVSTAYVSGLCDSEFRESDFDMGQSFRNDYEHSKFEAEKLVRAAEGFKSKTIYRPAVISGDAVTGYTPSYHGVYVYLRLMATMIPLEPVDDDGIRRISINLPMQGDEPRNLVPVDWVSAVMTRIICTPVTHNETYHLVPETPFTAKKLVEYSYDFFNSTGTTFSENTPDNYEEGKFASTFLENMSVYSDYEQTDPRFNCDNVKRICPDLVCPDIDRELIFKYYNFGIEDNWGKRKIGPVSFECWLSNNKDKIQETANLFCKQAEANCPLHFGLDVHGPGGGQWSVKIEEDGQTQFSIGLPGTETRTIQLPQTCSTQPPVDADSKTKSAADRDVGQVLLGFLDDLQNPNCNSSASCT